MAALASRRDSWRRTLSEQPRVLPGLVLAIGVGAVSVGAIFARLADAPALLVAASRSTIAALALGGWVAWRHRDEVRNIPREAWIPLVVAGFMLAVHFATWITSLGMTSVASSVVLVNTTPFWVAFAAPRITGDRVTRRMALGIAIGLAGSVVVGFGDFRASGVALTGDLLALIGGLASAGYVLAGRKVRQVVSLPVYGTLCYGLAGVLLWMAVLAFGVTITGLSSVQWGWIALVGLVPQLIGHSSYNWVLGHVSAPIVSVCLISEPILASLMAWAIFHEQPSPNVLAGGLLICIGIVLAAWPEGSFPE